MCSVRFPVEHREVLWFCVMLVYFQIAPSGIRLMQILSCLQPTWPSRIHYIFNCNQSKASLQFQSRVPGDWVLLGINSAIKLCGQVCKYRFSCKDPCRGEADRVLERGRCLPKEVLRDCGSLKETTELPVSLSYSALIFYLIRGVFSLAWFGSQFETLTFLS